MTATPSFARQDFRSNASVPLLGDISAVSNVDESLVRNSHLTRRGNIWLREPLRVSSESCTTRSLLHSLFGAYSCHSFSETEAHWLTSADRRALSCQTFRRLYDDVIAPSVRPSFASSVDAIDDIFVAFKVARTRFMDFPRFLAALLAMAARCEPSLPTALAFSQLVEAIGRNLNATDVEPPPQHNDGPGTSRVDCDGAVPCHGELVTATLDAVPTVSPAVVSELFVGIFNHFRDVAVSSATSTSGIGTEPGGAEAASLGRFLDKGNTAPYHAMSAKAWLICMNAIGFLEPRLSALPAPSTTRTRRALEKQCSDVYEMVTKRWSKRSRSPSGLTFEPFLLAVQHFLSLRLPWLHVSDALPAGAYAALGFLADSPIAPCVLFGSAAAACASIQRVALSELHPRDPAEQPRVHPSVPPPHGTRARPSADGSAPSRMLRTVAHASKRGLSRNVRGRPSSQSSARSSRTNSPEPWMLDAVRAVCAAQSALVATSLPPTPNAPNASVAPLEVHHHPREHLLRSKH